jgi:lysophospholipase L1-like esterase
MFNVNRSWVVIMLLMLLACGENRKKVSIFSIGDSTMANFDIEKISREAGGVNYPLRGWMMELPLFLKDKFIIHNRGVDGASSRTYREKGYWKKVIDSVQKGDYIFIQFGHNDAGDESRHTEPRTTFRQNLIRYIKETQGKGAHPILFTSIPYRNFDDKGNVVDKHGDYVNVPRELATEMHVPLIDLNKRMTGVIQKLGPEESKKLYLRIPPGKFTNLPKGLIDDCHLNEAGAVRVAEEAAHALEESNALENEQS